MTFGHTCVNLVIILERSIVQLQLFTSVNDSRNCVVQAYLREVIYIEDLLMSPFFSSCNLHVCLWWVYKALMGGAETA